MKQVVILFIFVFLTSCSFFTERIIEKSPGSLNTATEVNNILSIIRLNNSTLKTFKGIGKITFWQEDKKGVTSNIAWIGSEPDLIRISILNISGQPALSLSNDGKWLYFLFHNDNRFYKKKSSYSVLEKLIQIPIKPFEIVSFLSGRIPLYEYQTAHMISNKKEKHIIVLKKSKNVIQKIYLNEDKKKVRKVEFFKERGKFLYSLEICEFKKINNYQIPMRIIVKSDNGKKCKIDIHKYWADALINQLMFVLQQQ